VEWQAVVLVAIRRPVVWVAVLAAGLLVRADRSPAIPTDLMVAWLKSHPRTMKHLDPVVSAWETS
jgi:hypothetical protein